MLWGRSIATTVGPERLEAINRVTDQGTEQFCNLPGKYGKPIACVRWSSDLNKDTVATKLVAAGIPVYDTPDQCARAMNALATYAEFRRRKD
jgi:acyl-CoA synthetase (NDP forming)